MSLPRARTGVHYVLALVWLAYTVAMAAWWLSVGITLTDRRTMFLMEGATFFVVLVAGGLALIVAIRREHVRRQSLETFFMSFTHDLKTSLASVQLQAESLREDWPGDRSRGGLDQLLGDTLRLQIQLENSLFVAQPDGRLLSERIDVARAIERLAAEWPALEVAVDGNAVVVADARGFDAIVRNLFQNAVVHGGATRLTVSAARPSTGVARVTLTDNGRGLAASARAQVGRPFTRLAATSGSGVGLYVCRLLAFRMHGSIAFPDHEHLGGFVVTIDLPEAR